MEQDYEYLQELLRIFRLSYPLALLTDKEYQDALLGLGIDPQLVVLYPVIDRLRKTKAPGRKPPPPRKLLPLPGQTIIEPSEDL